MTVGIVAASEVLASGFSANRFYFPSSGTAPASPAYGLGASGITWNQTNQAARLPLVTTPTGTAHAQYSVSETSASRVNCLIRQFVSAPLAAQSVPAGTLSCVIGGLSNSSTGDAFLQIKVGVVSGDGTTTRGLLASGSTDDAASSTSGAQDQEFGTAGEQTRLWNGIATSSVGAQSGDRLVVEIGARYANTVTTSKTISLSFEDRTTSTDLALGANADASSVQNKRPWIEFSQALNFL